MRNLAIDLGTYSLKFIEFSVDKKNIRHLRTDEYVLSEHLLAQDPEVPFNKRRIQLVKHYLQQNPVDGKVFLQFPNTSLTTRSLHVPIKSRKKAEMMIPFQLEEDIPYPLSDVHMDSYVLGEKDGMHALVSLLPKTVFEEFYQELTAEGIRVDVITSEACLMSHFAQEGMEDTDYCILDLGHETSKAYFFKSGQLFTVQTSFIAGATIDETISQNYRIGLPEAIVYKHRTSFILNDDQMDSVSDEQREFALMMRMTVAPLVQDLKKWFLGFRVKHGTKVNNLYVTGGTANIRNLLPYLSYELKVPAYPLDTYEQTLYNGPEFEHHEKLSFNLANLLANGARRQGKLINFLKGEYASTSSEDLPLYSMAFIATRGSIVLGLLASGLFLENFLLRYEISRLDDRVMALMKNRDFALTPRELRQVKTDPQQILNRLNRLQENVRQEVKLIQSAKQINSLHPLIKLSKGLRPGSQTYLKEFRSSDDGTASAVFQSTDVADLQGLQGQVQSLSLSKLSADIQEKDKTLTIEFEYDTK